MCSTLVVATGTIVLIGWAFDLPVLTRLHPSLASMKVNTALAFVLAGAALWLRREGRAGGNRVRVARLLGALVAIVGLLTLLEHALGLSLGIDEIIVRDLATTPDHAPGRMSVVTAVALAALGGALLLIDVRVGRDGRPAEWLALLVGLIALLALLGYAYDARALYSFSPYSSVAVHTSLALGLSSIAVLAVKPEAGLMRIVTGDGPGGLLARRLLPFAILVPAALAFLRWQGERAGLYGSAFGLAIYAVSNAVCFTAMVWWTAAVLTRHDQARRSAEAQVRDSEENLATTLDSIGDAVIATDADGRVVRLNPEAERLTGWPAADAHGRPLDEVFRIVNEDTRRPVDSPVAIVLREGVTVGLANHTLLIARDGTERAIGDSGAPIRSPGGTIRGVVLVFRDMSDARAAERTAEELRKTEEQLRQLQKLDAIGRLAGGIAHDFNNMLSVILTAALSSARSAPEGEIRRDLEDIIDAAQRAAALTRQLLAFSSQQILEPRVIDLNEVVASLSKLLHRVVGEDVQLTVRAAPELDRVRADPGQIEQVLMNLVINARDAMPGGGTICIETANVDLDEGYAAEHAGATPGPHVMLSVGDSGIGMDRETQARIFEPFFTTKEKGKGTGLGLATVFGIVKQSGGSIHVRSEPGRGSTFEVYLPRTDQPATAPGRTSGAVTAVSGGTILVVEDDPQVRALIVRVLRNHDYRVLDAGDGAGALALIESHHREIRLILTDVVMPAMSGRELADRVTARCPDVKIVFMSGYTDDAILQRGVLPHGFAVLQKPLTPDSLLTKVEDVLGAD